MNKRITHEISSQKYKQVNVGNIIALYGTPSHMYDQEELRPNCGNLKEQFKIKDQYLK